MQAALNLAQSPSPSSTSSPHRLSGLAQELTSKVHAALWHGNELGTPVAAAISTGHVHLDAELPGGGWPCHALTEILSPQHSVLEWRLLGPALRQIVACGQPIVIVGPPRHPHLPGLRHHGINERHLIWLRPDTPGERLWTTEQLVKSNACGALLSWLPQAHPEQLRRLQIAAQGCEGPVFLFRPQAARFEASPAPLRAEVRFELDWELHVHLLKRRGPAHEGHIVLPSIPGGLAAVLTPRLHKPSRLFPSPSYREAVTDVVGSSTSGTSFVRPELVHAH